MNLKCNLMLLATFPGFPYMSVIFLRGHCLYTCFNEGPPDWAKLISPTERNNLGYTALEGLGMC